jgi:hypothetical protein
MDNSFSYQTRVAMCEKCGAPLDVAVGGGHVQCGYCGVANELLPRDENPLAGVHGVNATNEQERFARLRAQDGKPSMPPEDIIGLFAQGELVEWKVDEAVQIWQDTRRGLRAASDPVAGERLMSLTMALSNHFSKKEDPARQRAMFESGLDVVSLPRHKQMLRGYLSRLAARKGDLPAAEQWLAPCDPRSDDLEMDSSWRMSRAFIDTAKGDSGAVVAVLGRGLKDVPIMDSMEPLCILIRANALERLGEVEPAADQVVALMMAGGGGGRRMVTEVVKRYQDWGLCQQSYPVAQAKFAAAASQVSASSASGGIGGIFYFLGLAMLIPGLAGGLIFMLESLAGESLVGFLPSGLREGLGAVALPFIISGVVLTAIGRNARRAAAKAAHIRVHGIPAVATVVGLDRTGTTVNNVPQIRIRLSVQLKGKEPYEASVKMYLDAHQLGAYSTGSQVSVRVDPGNPQDLVIEN